MLKVSQKASQEANGQFLELSIYTYVGLQLVTLCNSPNTAVEVGLGK